MVAASDLASSKQLHASSAWSMASAQIWVLALACAYSQPLLLAVCKSTLPFLGCLSPQTGLSASLQLQQATFQYIFSMALLSVSAVTMASIAAFDAIGTKVSKLHCFACCCMVADIAQCILIVLTPGSHGLH